MIVSIMLFIMENHTLLNRENFLAIIQNFMFYANSRSFHAEADIINQAENVK